MCTRPVFHWIVLRVVLLEAFAISFGHKKYAKVKTGQFAEAKEVLNEMASENNRSFLPYGL